MKLVIFDCDGTLVDSQLAICSAMAQAFARCRLARPSPEAVRSVVGLSLAEAISRLLPSAEPARVAAVKAAYETAFGELCGDPTFREELFPGAREAILELAARREIALGIATGKPMSAVMRVLDVHGLSAHFRTVQTADRHASKPHPSMIWQAMSDVRADRNETVMIGDTTFDMMMGVNAGVATIGVSWGYHPAETLKAAGASEVVGDFMALRRLLDDVLTGE